MDLSSHKERIEHSMSDKESRCNFTFGFDLKPYNCVYFKIASSCAALRGFAITQSAPAVRKVDTSSFKAFPVSPKINLLKPC